MRAGAFTNLGVWVLLVGVALSFRPLMPIDETRYIAAAWEMHLSGNWLVPHLNGETYSHKPPLLFWLVNIGWQIFGVSEIWARLVAPLFGLGALGLTALLARLLWPGATGQRAAELAPTILLGSAFWALFSTLTMFDCIMAFFALLGLCGLIIAARAQSVFGLVRGFGLVALAIGFGVLAKGPVILVYVLPVAVLAPWWAAGLGRRWLPWFFWLIGAIAIGAGIALSWALPAAKAGGEAFGNAILWGQTAGRVRDSFAHQRPIWWYLPLLPLMLLPWLFWSPVWRAFAWRRLLGLDAGQRLCLVSAFSGLIIFSVISGKQPHYLLPLFPAFALFVARALAGGEVLPGGRSHWLPVLFVAVLALTLAAIPVIAAAKPALLARFDLPDWGIAAASEIAVGLFISIVATIMLSRDDDPRRRVGALIILPVAIVVLAHVFGMGQARPSYDLSPMASMIRKAQEEGRPVANAGDYHGEFHFLGRLRQPLAEISFAEIETWLQQNPQGRVVARYVDLPKDSTLEPVFTQPLRGRQAVLWGIKAAP